MLSFLFRLLACCALLGCSAVLAQDRVNISFVLQTANAAWPARYWGSVESYPLPLNGNGQSLPANSLLLFAGTGTAGYLEDVWGSSDQGRSWVQLAAGAYTGTRFPAYAIDSKARLFKVAGGTDAAQVWMSTNGVQWTQQTPGSAATTLSPRYLHDMQVDGKDALYVVGGLGPGAQDGGMNDVWKSTDQGKNWVKQLTSMPFPQPPGRSSGFLLHSTSKQTKQDVLTFMGGYSRVGGNQSSVAYHNDIYMSTDGGQKWLLVTAAAPWSKRDNINAEVTRDGALVLVAGFSDAELDANDVWVSMDGGWTWGLCVQDAQWTDRRWQMTVLDADGYLYVMGGDENLNRTGQRVPKNDVWRSSFSLNDNAALSRACGVDVPACGVGLTCTPGPNTRIVNGRVTCPAIELCQTNNLGFTAVTAHADWPARHSPGVEFLSKSMRVGSTTYPVGSMVLYGGTGPSEQLMNDVWLSSNGGASWQEVSQTGNGFPGSAWSGHIIDSQNRIYKIGGERWGSPNTANGEVYMSTNAGVTWTRQQNTSRTTGLPARSFPDTYVDEKDRIYVAGGLAVPGPGLNDVWMSSDQGKNWYRQGGIPFGSPPGRSSASLLIHRSPVLQKEIMYYFGGYSRGGATEPMYHNDVWVSSDLGKQWRLLTAAAPWTERDNFNAEITADGLIVFTGGLNSREAMNDVWVSADGGYTWGSCVAEAQFTDRRWHATAMDRQGNFYLIGGEEIEFGQYVKQNDVWKSSFAFSKANARRIQTACGITYPKCNAGLSCWPGSQKVDARTGQVTCTLLNTYTSLGCTFYDPEDPDTWGSSGQDGWESSSTGAEPASSGGLSIGLIALIVVLVLVGVVAIGGYFYYNNKKQANAQSVIPGLGTDGLLGTGHTDSSSEGQASGSDYYSQGTAGTV